MKKIIARNRKAKHNYYIEETVEAGIALAGSEVKSVRAGNVSLAESFVHISPQAHATWVNGYIKEYKASSVFNHEVRRSRQLLLKKKEIRQLQKKIQKKGYTLVPLELYFAGRYAKLKFGLGRGKKKYDKREDLKKKESAREMDRYMKKMGRT